MYTYFNLIAFRIPHNKFKIKHTLVSVLHIKWCLVISESVLYNNESLIQKYNPRYSVCYLHSVAGKTPLKRLNIQCMT